MLLDYDAISLVIGECGVQTIKYREHPFALGSSPFVLISEFQIYTNFS